MPSDLVFTRLAVVGCLQSYPVSELLESLNSGRLAGSDQELHVVNSLLVKVRQDTWAKRQSNLEIYRGTCSCLWDGVQVGFYLHLVNARVA